MRSLNISLLSVLLFLILAPEVWAEDSTESPFYSRDLLAQTLSSGLQEGDEEQAQQVQSYVDSLSDEQVFALNRSLNDSLKNGTQIDFTGEENWALLQQAADENYNSRQMNMLIQALESEARFQSLADKILNLTGDEDKYQRFMTKADTEKNKFLSFIDRMENTGPQSLDDLQTDDAITSVTETRSGEVRWAADELARQKRLNASSQPSFSQGSPGGRGQGSFGSSGFNSGGGGTSNPSLGSSGSGFSPPAGGGPPMGVTGDGMGHGRR